MRPGKCSDRIERIKDIEKEYQVAIIARRTLGDDLKKDPSHLKGNGLERSDFDRFGENLGATYLIRIFAEFESGLRDYWKSSLKRKTVPMVSTLIRSISSRRKIHFQEIEDVDDVRQYRNKVVHEEDLETRVVDLKEARKSLCAFFRRLPEDW